MKNLGLEKVLYKMNSYEKIKELRTEKGITQAELADITGLSQGLISRVEKGERRPTQEASQKIAKALDVSVEDLLGRSENKEILFRNVEESLTEREIEQVNSFIGYLKTQRK